MAATEVTTETGRRASRADLMELVDALVRRAFLSPESRSHALLVYLIDHHLTRGPDEPVKAYAIAVDVLGRGAEFDPAQDSIVRVEIGRLRKLLDLYAEGPGRGEPLRVTLPRGQSHLAVVRQEATTPDAPTAPAPRRWAGRPAQIAAAVLAAGLIGLGLYAALRPPALSADIAAALDADYPRVFVRPLVKDGPTGAAFPHDGLARVLADALSGWRSFRVVAPAPPTSLPVRAGDYVLDGTAGTVPGDGPAGLALSLRLRDGTGAVLWSDALELDAAGPGAAPAVYAALADVAGTLGGALGVIDADGRARMAEAGATWSATDGSAFRCFLRWQSFDLTKDPEEGRAARACLEALAAAETPVGQIWAALATLRYLEWSVSGSGREDPRLAAALAAANRAVLVDPAGADGHEALGAVLTGLGRNDAARAALQAALQRNPSNLETLVQLGWLDALEGDWETGRDRIAAVAARHQVVPGWYRLPLALDALRLGDVARLRAEAEAMVAAGDRRGLVLALAAARTAGDGEQALAVESALAGWGLTPDTAVAEIAAVFPDPVVTDTLRAAVVP